MKIINQIKKLEFKNFNLDFALLIVLGNIANCMFLYLNCLSIWWGVSMGFVILENLKNGKAEKI